MDACCVKGRPRGGRSSPLTPRLCPLLLLNMDGGMSGGSCGSLCFGARRAVLAWVMNDALMPLDLRFHLQRIKAIVAYLGTAGRMPRHTSGAGCKRLPTPPLHLFWTGTQAISPWPCNRFCVRPWGTFLRRFRGAPHGPMRVLYRRVFFCILRPSGGRRSGLDQNLPVRKIWQNRAADGPAGIPDAFGRRYISHSSFWNISIRPQLSTPCFLATWGMCDCCWFSFSHYDRIISKGFVRHCKRN